MKEDDIVIPADLDSKYRCWSSCNNRPHTEIGKQGILAGTMWGKRAVVGVHVRIVAAQAVL